MDALRAGSALALAFAATTGSLACPREVRPVEPPRVEPRTRSIESACDDWASVACDRDDECRHGQFLALWRDGAQCRARRSLECRLGAQAHGSGTTAEKLDGCIEATRRADCDVLSTGDRLEACAMHGEVAAGSFCVADAQCARGTCDARSMIEPNPCFRCADAREGDYCGPLLGCADGFVCMFKACVARGKPGEPCAWSEQCGETGTCVVDTGANGVCRPSARLGEACSAVDSVHDKATCATFAGLGCKSGRCVAVTWLAIGDACRLDDENARCRGGECADGKCVPRPAEGSECLFGSICLPPANCLSGRCALPDEKSCVVK